MKNLLIFIAFSLIPFISVRAQESGTVDQSADSSAITDSIPDSAQIDSLARDFTLIFYHLRSQNEALEAALVKRNRMITVLVVLIALFALLIFRISSKKIVHGSFPFYRQKRGEQPAYACLRMMYQYYYGKKISYKKIAGFLPETNNPLSLDDVASVSEKLGFEVKISKTGLQELMNDLSLPVMVYLPNHMAVLFDLKHDVFYLSDPFYGHIGLKTYYFATSWFVDQKNLEGIAMILFPVHPSKKRVAKKLQPEKFKSIRQWDRRNWKNYTFEVVSNGG